MFGEKDKTIIYIGSDHAGFALKEILKPFLIEKGYSVTDLGCFNEEACDYPDLAGEVAEKVVEMQGSFGILLCGTGIGMAIAANRRKGIRAAHCLNEEMAEITRKHNNANVLALGGRTTEPELAKKIALKFLTTPFDGDERHVRRIEKMDKLGDGKK